MTNEDIVVGCYNGEVLTVKRINFDQYDLTQDELIEQGKQIKEKEIFDHLGFKNPPIGLLEYLDTIQRQAMAWQLLDEVFDHSVNLHVAANKLRREIEKARGIK